MMIDRSYRVIYYAYVDKQNEGFEPIDLRKTSKY
jgi:hypothetical protein